MNNETRQTTTISLPADMMEFVKNNGDNVSKFMQELISKCMDAYSPFSQVNNYGDTARKLFETSIELFNMYIDSKRPTFHEIHVSTFADPNYYSVDIATNPLQQGSQVSAMTSISTVETKSPKQGNFINTSVNIEASTKVMHIGINFTPNCLSSCRYQIDLAQGDHLYTEFMKALSRYSSLIASQI